MKLSENSVTYQVARMILSLGGGVLLTTRYGVSVPLWGTLEVHALDFFQMQNEDCSGKFYFWVITDLKYN
jgi:hypothetical protein